MTKRPAALWVLVALTAGCDICYFDDGETTPTPDLFACHSPQVWQDSTCNEICDAAAGSLCVEDADRCEGEVAWGYKRRDACEDRLEAMSVASTCESPLSSDLTSSIYFVRCCCVETDTDY